MLLLSSHNIYFLLRCPATSSGSLTSSSITGVFQFLFPFFLNLTNAEIFPQETVCRRRLYQTGKCPRWNLFLPPAQTTTRWSTTERLQWSSRTDLCSGLPPPSFGPPVRWVLSFLLAPSQIILATLVTHSGKAELYIRVALTIEGGWLSFLPVFLRMRL